MKKRTKILIIVAASIVFALALTVGLIFGIGSCNQSIIIVAENTTTVRKRVPTDGTTPEDYDGLDNIAFMAYVLDHQPSYHAYANNSTRATAYEQITQTWKDYKSAELSGKNTSIMICSDLSYSSLVKSASQSCFVGDGTAYMRTGEKPGKDSVPTDINWSTDQPAYYAKKDYLETYGEFSTEISVYAINSTTVESCGELVKNEDGTYSQTYTLKADAACWYQYGMKTRGGLKGVPKFEKIEITFTFDSGWRVLSSYCEERTKIAPGALGGIDMSSNSKTTTTFYYDDNDFDTAHYAYFDSFFNSYVGTVIENKPDGEKGVELLDVLAGGFGKVLSNDGQQFNLNLTFGSTGYEGKVYLKLAEVSVDAIEARLALEKSGSGKQDFYLEYKNGVANAYFSDAFAMTADIGKISSSVKNFSAWVDSLVSEEDDGLTVQSDSGTIDVASLLNALKLTVGEDTVKISLASDNLLDLGIGVDAELLFGYTKGEDGYSYSFKELKLNALSYDSENLDLGLGISPDEGTEIISRTAGDNPADIASYIDGVLALAKSGVYEVNISLDGSCESIDYINGLLLNVNAKIAHSDDFTAFTANVPISVTYGGLSVSLTADYAVNLSDGGYGDIYLTLNSINGAQYGVKVKCNVNEITDAVKMLVAEFAPADEPSAQAEEGAAAGIANVINKVLNLDFAAVLKEIKADGENISLKVNVDEVLSALEVHLGFSLGELDFSLGLSGGKAALGGGLPALGAKIAVSGGEGELPAVTPADYTDITAFVSGVHRLLTAKTYAIDITLDGTCESIEYLKGASTQLTVLVKPDEKFENITVNVPAFTVNYKGLTVTLSAYYKLNVKEISNGNYGEVYLTLSEIGGRVIDVKAHCDINDTITAVKELIELFAPSSSAAAEGGAKAASGVLDTVLSLDYGAILTEISANGDSIKLGVNADALVTAFDVDLGFNIGTVKLTLALENGIATLGGRVEGLGLSLGVGASSEEVHGVNTGVYADVASYINGVKSLITSDSYLVSLTLDGTCESIEYIKGVTASAEAVVKVSADFSEIQVYVPSLKVSCQGLTVTLSAYYTVALNGGGYGTVYLDITEIGGQSVGAKVYCRIDEVITAVKQIIDMYSGKDPEPEALSDEPAAEEPAAEDKIAKIINKVVSLDYKAIIKSLTADNTGVNVAVDADELLKAVDFTVKGVQLGEASVAVSLGADNALALGVTAKEFGLTLGLSGSELGIPELYLNTYADLTSYVNGVYNLLNSKTYNVNIGFTGSAITFKEGSDPIDLTGLNAEISAQVKLSKNFKEITVSAPVTVTYDKLKVVASLYYTVNLDNGYGDIYVTLNSINDDTFGAKVYCNIDDTVTGVKQLIDLFAPSTTTVEEAQQQEKSKLTVAQVIAKVASLDYKAIINELTADSTGVSLSVNADAILKALNVDTKGIKLGDVNLALGIDGAKCATLTGSVPEFGITLNFGGNAKDIPAFNGDGYFDLGELVNIVTEAVNEAQAIIDGKNAVFELDTSLTADGVKMRVDGDGQVDWNNGMIRVAVEADLTISEGEHSETLKLKLVYDEDNLREVEGVTEEVAPLVRFTVNDLGMAIYRSDLDGVKDGFNEIKNIVLTIVNAFKTEDSEEQTPENGSQGGTLTENTAEGEIMLTAEEGAEVSGETTEENKLNKLLTKVFEEIQKVTVSLLGADGAQSKQLIVKYAENATLTLAANGGLSLKLDVKNNNATEIVKIQKALIRAAGETDKFALINAAFDYTGENAAENTEEKTVYTFYSAQQQGMFTKAVYDYVFAVLDDLTVKNLLGSDTYTVSLVLDGNASGIQALKDVYVSADIYYTELAAEGAEKGEKLVEMSLDISVGKISVKAKAYYYCDTLYISIGEINGTQLANTSETATVDGQEIITYSDGLNVRANTQDIYIAADAVVKLITNENILPLVNTFAPAQISAQSEEANGEASQPADPAREANGSTLKGILNALLSIEVKFGKEDGINSLVLNADALLEELGLGFGLGTVTVEVNPATHAITAKAVKDDISWLTASAEAVKAENTVHGVAPATEDYIDIGFIKTLVGDVNTTLGSLGTRTETTTDEDGNVKTEEKPDVRVSLTGDLNVDIKYSVVEATVPVNKVKITVGLDENKKFFFSLTGELENKSAKLGISLGDLAVITQAWKISVTYSNGYITMGRQHDTVNEKFKVMTVEFLLDNLLDKNNSPVRWLLGTSSTVWGLVCDNLPASLKDSLGSGLTKIEDYYLYEHTEDNVPDNTEEEDAKAVFVLSALLNGMGVKLDDYTSIFGNGAAPVTSQLSLNNNYYAFDLNLSSLVGDTFSKVYAALIRDGDGGLNGVKAYATINADGKEVVKVSVNLNGGIITAETETDKHALDYFKIVVAANPGINFGFDNGSKKFGCYNTENNSYDYSEYNQNYILNVYDFGGTDYASYPVNVKADVLNEKHKDVTLKSGATVYLLENETWLDEDQKTLKLIYVDENGNDLGLSFRLRADTDIYMMIVGENKVHFYDKGNNACNVVGSEDNSLVLYAGDTLPDPQSLTATVDGVECTFAGWYTEGYEQLVTSVQAGVDKYYAKFVQTEVILSNGVMYTFIRNAAETEVAHYIVAKFNSANVTDGADYANGDTLVLANVIDGYKVTEIAANALASSNGYYLKNVVVPSNIQAVGEKAFLDNYGMKSVVFLAEKVTMSGSVDGKSYPFYGCSTANGTSNTELNVYYNSVSPETQWNHFRDGNNFIGVGNAGGSLNGAGTWGYINYSVTEDYYMSDFGYAEGLVTRPINSAYLNEIKAAIIAKLNTNTADSGLIYKYTVNITDNVEEAIHYVTVSIMDDTANAWNKLVLDDSDIQLEMTSDIETVNGAYFVKQNSTVTVKPVSGNEGLTRLTVYDNVDKSILWYDSTAVPVTASLSFIMKNKFAYVVAERANLPITEITLKSVIQLDGFTDADGDGVYEKSLSISEDDELTYTVSMEGYTFLGWAYENSGNCLEFEATVKHRSYFAVWAVNRDEVSSVSVSGGAFVAEVAEDKAVSVYGWYVYENVDGSVKFNTPVTYSSLTTSTTLIYPRMVFKLTYELSSSLSGTNHYFVNDDGSNNDNKPTKEGGTLTGSINILEATDLQYLWNHKTNGEVDTNKLLKIIFTDETGTEKELYFRIKNKGTGWFDGWSTKEYTITGAITNSQVPETAAEANSLTVGNNLELYFAARS